MNLSGIPTSVIFLLQSDNIEEIINTILEKWHENIATIQKPEKKSLDLKVEEQLVKLLETTKVQSVAKERQYTEEEKRIREQILAQYSQVRYLNFLHALSI